MFLKIGIENYLNYDFFSQNNLQPYSIQHKSVYSFEFF